MDLKQIFTIFAELDNPNTRALLEKAQQIEVAANTTLFRQGDSCKNYLLVLEGNIKVFTRAENGREIVLYRLGSGDSCVLTTSCLFGNTHYSAEGVSDTKVTALAIPAELFKASVESSEIFRNHVFKAFSSHLSRLITLVEEVAFGKLDIRLAKYLLSQCEPGCVLKTTHQDLATELGTAREVISRQLKELETHGLLELARGSVRITDKTALEKISLM